jgi:GNAT superfamily N-acetyltransferase
VYATVTIALRPMTAADVGRVPLVHQGEPDEVRRRIADLGSSAILAFDGAQHVGQLQFRRYEPGIRSPRGLHHPLYWVDFEGRSPDVPAGALAVFCYHVGQLDDTEARDVRYQGQGLGARLLDAFLHWATAAGFPAVVAKAVPPVREVMAYMGGQPPAVYEARGFAVVASWRDAELRAAVEERGLAPAAHLDEAARVSCCVRRLGPGPMR